MWYERKNLRSGLCDEILLLFGVPAMKCFSNVPSHVYEDNFGILVTDFGCPRLR